MIIEYHSPDTISEAITLFSRTTPRTIPIGGGTVISRISTDEEIAVINLAGLNMDRITQDDTWIMIGANTALQKLIESSLIQPSVKAVVQKEDTRHIRNVASLAGALVTADGRSPLAALMLALDAQLIWNPGEQILTYESWLPIRQNKWPGYFIEAIKLPINHKVSYHAITRSPSDLPIICIAASKFLNERVRVVVGGFGHHPLVIYEGHNYHEWLPQMEKTLNFVDDEWGSGKYRTYTAQVLVNRALSELETR